MPIADALRSTRGGRSRAASVRASSPVPCVRLSRMRRRESSVQRWAMFSPARWIAASTPSSARASMVPRAGSQVTSLLPGRGSPRETRTTAWPAAASAGTSALPRKPPAPVTAMRIEP